jgi:hypothetical protein
MGNTSSYQLNVKKTEDVRLSDIGYLRDAVEDPLFVDELMSQHNKTME